MCTVVPPARFRHRMLRLGSCRSAHPGESIVSEHRQQHQHPIDASSLDAFLRSYVAAFNACDGAAIARHYHLPSLSLRGDGLLSLLTDAGEAQAFFGTMARSYRDQGAADWQWQVEQVTPIGRECALATVHWSMLRADATVLRDWRHSYNLLARDGALRILLATFNAA